MGREILALLVLWSGTAVLLWKQLAEGQTMRRDHEELLRQLRMTQSDYETCMGREVQHLGGAAGGGTAVPDGTRAVGLPEARASARDLENGGKAVFNPRHWPQHIAPRSHEDLPVRYTVDGRRCMLPFSLDGKQMLECVSLPGSSSGVTWCPTEGDIKPGPHGGAGDVTVTELRTSGGECQANFNEQALVENTINRVYARIGASAVGGIGVVAVRTIPKGTEPFMLPDGQSCGIGEYINLDRKLVADAPSGVKNLMNDFFAIEPDGKQLVPVQGLNALTLSYYLNHADGTGGHVPNMMPRPCNCPVMCFFATSDILEGEELMFDYVGAFGEGALDQGTFEEIFGRKKTSGTNGR